MWFVPGLVALVPGAVRLWLGRSLARRLDDPALPERLVASRTLPGVAFGLSLGVLIAIWPDRLVWTAPLVIFTHMAAGYPLRKALYGDTWSLATYMWFFTRLIAAVWGFWLLLMAAPLLTDRPGAPGWALAAALAAVLIIWSDRHDRVIRWVLRAAPIDRPDLAARLAALAARTAIPTPRFDRVPLHGGALANALALPSTERPGVLFSDTLLTRFSDDEIVAVAAHELAHHEHFTRRRLRRLRLASIALVLAATTLAPVLHWIGDGLTWQWAVALVAAVILFIAALGRQRQQHETAADMRAVELIGDPEPLVGALEKLHAFARLPRRWDQRVEQQVTHPSLANRIRAIRQAAGRPPAELIEGATFNTADGSRTSATVHTDRLVWVENDASFSLPYSALSRLTIEAGRTGAARLVAADAKGRRWELVLAAGDVARAQAALAVVDVRIAPPSPASSVHPVARVMLLLASVVALFAGQLAAAIVALLAFVEPRSPLLAAAAVSLLLAAALMLRDGGSQLTGGNAVWPIAVALLCGAFFGSLAWRLRAVPASRQTWRIVAILAICALTLLVPIVSASIDLVGAHQGARQWSGFAVLTGAIAGAMLARPEAWARAVAGLSALAAVAVLVIGSTAFLDRAVRDPFLLPRPAAAGVTLTSPVREFTITVDPINLWLSPGGRSIVVAEQVDEAVVQLHAGRAGGALTPIAGSHTVFVDDDTLLVAEVQSGSTVIRRAAVDAPGPAVWEHRLPEVRPSGLSLIEGGAWQVLGVDAEGGIVSIEGGVEGGATREQRWTDADLDYVTPVIADAGHLLVTEPHYLDSWLGRLAWQLSPLFAVGRSRTGVSILSASGRRELARSLFDVDCGGQPSGRDAVCTAFDGSRTHVVSIDARGRTISAIATLPGRFFVHTRGPGWLAGRSRGGGPAALRLDDGLLVRMEVPRGSFRSFIAGAGGWLATVSPNADEVQVRIYAAPGK